VTAWEVKLSTVESLVVFTEGLALMFLNGRPRLSGIVWCYCRLLGRLKQKQGQLARLKRKHRLPSRLKKKQRPL